MRPIEDFRLRPREQRRRGMASENPMYLPVVFDVALDGSIVGRIVQRLNRATGNYSFSAYCGLSYLGTFRDEGGAHRTGKSEALQAIGRALASERKAVMT